MLYTAQQARQLANNLEVMVVMNAIRGAVSAGQFSVRQEFGMKPAVGQRVKQKLEALGYVVTVHGQQEDELEGTLFDVEISWDA